MNVGFINSDDLTADHVAAINRQECAFVDSHPALVKCRRAGVTIPLYVKPASAGVHAVKLGKLADAPRGQAPAPTPSGARLALPDVTLVCVDCRRPDLAQRAIERSRAQCDFGDVKFFTDADYPGAIRVGAIRSREDYSEFLLREMPEHITTPFALVIQWDGYVLDASKWQDIFRKYDYIGAMANVGGLPDKRNGNGGFSFRSQKMMRAAMTAPGPNLSEDETICITHRAALESQGIKFAPPEICDEFSREGGECPAFGFHNFLTRIPDRPPSYHHSGDWGDIIYSLPAIAARGAGILLVTPHCNPEMPPRQEQTCEAFAQIQSLLEAQHYVWQARQSNSPISADYDFNRFRDGYKPDGRSLMQRQLAVCGAHWPETEPWLRVDFPISIPSRPILIHACPRKRIYNKRFPWKKLVEQHRAQMAFVGDAAEHRALILECGYVPYIPTADHLQLARVIAGAKCFIGSNSLPMAIAIGLGQNVIQEVLDVDDSAHFRRPNAIYVTGDKVDVPGEWLRG